MTKLSFGSFLDFIYFSYCVYIYSSHITDHIVKLKVKLTKTLMSILIILHCKVNTAALKRIHDLVVRMPVNLNLGGVFEHSDRVRNGLDHVRIPLIDKVLVDTVQTALNDLLVHVSELAEGGTVSGMVGNHVSYDL